MISTILSYVLVAMGFTLFGAVMMAIIAKGAQSDEIK